MQVAKQLALNKIDLAQEHDGAAAAASWQPTDILSPLEQGTKKITENGLISAQVNLKKSPLLSITFSKVKDDCYGRFCGGASWRKMAASD